MNGRRVYPPVPDDEICDPLPCDLQGGDYWYDPIAKYWMFVCPVSGYPIANLSAHKVIEHEDGTITVSPSILTYGHYNGQKISWHGYLERGIWREI
jgi:hypothetical protein